MPTLTVNKNLSQGELITAPMFPRDPINHGKVHDQEVEHLQVAWLMDEKADLH